MEGPGIEAAEAAAEGLAEALDHGSDAGNVVVGGWMKKRVKNAVT